MIVEAVMEGIIGEVVMGEIMTEVVGSVIDMMIEEGGVGKIF